MNEKKKTALFHCLAVIGLILLLWFLAVMGGASSFIVPVIIGSSVYFGFRKRFLLLLFLLLLNPLAYNFGLGCLSYFEGEPTLQYMGLPRIESHNVDRATRCFVSAGGCLVRGNEWVYLTPHNSAISMLSVVLGPGKGCYDGPYPTKEEALKMLENKGKTIAVSQFLNDTISIDGDVIQLEPETGQKIFNGLRIYPEFLSAKVVASLFEERCLVCRITAYDEFLLNEGEEDNSSPDFLIFYDANNGMPFAYFHIKGMSSRFHPVAYTDQSNIHAFFHAAQKGGTKRLEELLNQGFNINSRSRTGRTALMAATSSGKSSSVQFLLNNGANPNIKDNNGQTSLYLVSGISHIGCMKKLLKHGADVNVKDWSGSTPLIYMARFGPSEAVQLLSDAGAQLNDKDREGFTALDYAIQKNKEEAIRILENADNAKRQMN